MKKLYLFFTTLMIIFLVSCKDEESFYDSGAAFFIDNTTVYLLDESVTFTFSCSDNVNEILSDPNIGTVSVTDKKGTLTVSRATLGIVDTIGATKEVLFYVNTESGQASKYITFTVRNPFTFTVDKTSAATSLDSLMVEKNDTLVVKYSYAGTVDPDNFGISWKLKSSTSTNSLTSAFPGAEEYAIPVTPDMKGDTIIISLTGSNSNGSYTTSEKIPVKEYVSDFNFYFLGKYSESASGDIPVDYVPGTVYCYANPDNAKQTIICGTLCPAAAGFDITKPLETNFKLVVEFDPATDKVEVVSDSFPFANENGSYSLTGDGTYDINTQAFSLNLIFTSDKAYSFTLGYNKL